MELSDFEKQIIDQALQKLKLTIDPDPHRKTIHKFYIYTLSPFTSQDPFRFLNYLHVDSKDSVILNQILMSVGDAYNENILIQTDAELIYPSVRTMAMVLPVIPKDESLEKNQVDLLIITRDAFSLRLNTDFSFSGYELKTFNLGITENNVAGSNISAGIQFSLQPYLLNFSGQYYDPNFLNTSQEFTATQGLILNRKLGNYEGTQGSYKLQYPLDSQQISWGYQIYLDYVTTPQFVMNEDKIKIFKTAEVQAEEKYHWTEINGNLIGSYSFGTNTKNNFDFGYGFHHQKAKLLSDFPLEGKAANEFKEAVLPSNAFQSFLIFTYQYFWNRYEVLHDYNIFTLQEWIQVGPTVTFSNILGSHILFSDQNFWRPQVKLSYTFTPTRSSLIRFRLGGLAFLQNQWSDPYLRASCLFVSPILFGTGRLLLNAIFAKWSDNLKSQDNNYSKKIKINYQSIRDSLDSALGIDMPSSPLTLGNDNGLRAVPASYYSGSNLLNTNLEFRTVSMPISTSRLGGVLFYDFGAAFDNNKNFKFTHALGVGMRLLHLAFSRSVFRLDLAIPVAGPSSIVGKAMITFGIDQAF